MEPGIFFMVNGVPKRWRSLSVHTTDDAKLPVWTANVDGALGCAGTLEGAILMAARASDKDKPQEMEGGDK